MIVINIGKKSKARSPIVIRVGKKSCAMEDKIPGGLADKKKPSDFEPTQLAKGVKVEMEHVDDPDIAREIAMDHLVEDPKYYDKLATIEESEILSEISAEQVLDGISLDKNKFAKKFMHNLKTILGDFFEQQAKDAKRVQTIVGMLLRHFREHVELAIPDDINDSQRGAAANWIKNFFLSDHHIFKIYTLDKDAEHDSRQMRGQIEFFFQAQNFIPDGHSRDINSYKTIDDIIDVNVLTVPIYDAHRKKKQYLDADEGKKLIADTEEWLIYIPTNKGAACELGKGTNWCTAAPGLDYYEHYHTPEDPLYVFVNKSNSEERYQFH